MTCGMKRRKTGMLLLLAMLLGVCEGCAASKPVPTEEAREFEFELTMDPASVDIDPLVSNGEPDEEDQYPTTLLVESYAAPGFKGVPGSMGVCSGVLIEKDLVLTAGHCLCAQPMHNAVNKAINRDDCATRVLVKQYIRNVERYDEGDIEKTVTTYPKVPGVAFLHKKFRVDLNDEGEIVSIFPDVAVLRLEKPINIKLDYEPADREMRSDDRITVVGFGSTRVNGPKASRIRHFGKNTFTGTRVLEYSPDKKTAVGEVYHDYEANAERGDSGGPCFREEPGHRRLVGIVLHKRPKTGVKTTCLDLFKSKSLLDELIKQAKSNTN